MSGEQPASESPSVSRHRLRALSLCYLGLTALLLLWRNLVLRDHDPVLTVLNGTVMLALGWLIVRLSGRRPLASGRLRLMELTLIGILGGMVAVSHYHNMLARSLDGDATAALAVMQHTVLITSILIVSYGLYAPKSWLETAAVVTLLALLPYATLWVLQLGHPEVMTWLDRLPAGGWITPYLFSGFDAMFLLMLSAGSTIYGIYKRLSWSRKTE
jgi:serine/threonine-protein kinase